MRKREIPVVGFGSSAGGLEAITEIVSHLPNDTGMAFIFIQHLTKPDSSHLAEILARHTKLKINVVKNGIKVKRNQIYVSAPGYKHLLNGSVLKITKQSKKDANHLGFDIFLSSLADSRNSGAIGVVLSGTGTDGTLGLKAIKNVGGVTIVQDPHSAKFDGMPRSAIANGTADLIVRPKEIAEELVRIAKHPYTATSEENLVELKKSDLQGKDLVKNGEEAYQHILEMLKDHSNVNFALYKHTTVRRRIHRQLMLRKIETVENYAHYLKKNPEEIKALYEDIFIHITDFFRDPESFEALKTQIFPKLLSEKTKKDVRIWVPGCATGQEPYSLAMELAEYLETNAQKRDFKIFATDISEKAIQRARKGCFETQEVQNVSEVRLHKYFEKIKTGYKLKKFIRDKCVFSKHDVISNPPFAKLDLISCRNVLIYFSTDLQKKVLPIFHYALNNPGYLWLGRAEHPGSLSSQFVPIDKVNKIFIKNNAANFSDTKLKPTRFVTEKVIPSPLNPPNPLASAATLRTADQLILFKYSPPGVIVDSELNIIQYRGRVGPFLEPPPGVPNQNILKMANPQLLKSLKICMDEAKRTNASQRKEKLHINISKEKHSVNIEVSPLNPKDQEVDRRYLVLFEHNSAKLSTSEIPRYHHTNLEQTSHLQQELEALREHEQSLIEEYVSAQEELTSANEELQSTNEELQSTNEELNSTNEELQRTNHEVQNAYSEIERLNKDLENRVLARTQELELERQKLYSSFMQAPVPIAILQAPDLKYVLSNPPYEELADKGKLLGRTVYEIFPELSGQGIIETLQGVIRTKFTVTGKAIPVTLNSKSWNNETRYFDFIFPPLLDLDNKVEAVMIFATDVTDQVRARRQLEESEKEFRLIADSIPQMVWVADSLGRIQYSNNVIFEYAGLPGETDPLEMWKQIVFPLDFERISLLWDEALTKLKEFTAEYRIRRYDGEFRWHLARTRPFKNSQGKVIRWFGTATDIHDQYITQERSKILAEAGKILFSSLSYKKIVRSLADVAVTNLCDWCTIDLVTDAEAIPQSVAIAHPDPKMQNFALELNRKYPPSPNALYGATNVMRTGVAELFPIISDDILREVAQNDDHLNILRTLGMKSAMCVPLQAHGKTLGAITFISAESSRTYTQSDLKFAEDLANRAALAIENAKLYQAVGESEEQLTALADSMPQLAWIARGDGFIFWYNKRWYDYTGMTKEQQEGWGWQSVHHPDELSRVLESWRAAIATGNQFELEFPLRAADGRYRWFLTRSTPIKDAAGKVVRWFGTNTDIEEQKKAREFLAESETRFRTMADSAPVLIWTSGPDGLYDYFNKSWLTFTGRSLEEELGRGWLEGIHPQDSPELLKTQSLSFANRRAIETKFRLKHHTGEYRWVSNHGVPRFDESGEFKGYIGSCNDIHDQKLSEEKLQSAIHARDEFLSIASHELKTPITSLSLQIQIAKKNLKAEGPVSASNEKIAKVFDISSKQINRLTGLVEDLLDASRIRTGNFSINFETVSLTMIVRDMIERSSAQFEKAKCVVTSNIKEDIYIQGDQSRLEQVMDNLFSNSIKYAAESHITVELYSNQATATIRVKDTGPGIPKEKQQGIFERYERAVAPTNISGLGLGLYIVREIILGHMGTIELVSDINLGTEFVINLPLGAGNQNGTKR